MYLTPQDYTTVSSLNSVHCKHIEEDGESRSVSYQVAPSFCLWLISATDGQSLSLPPGLWVMFSNGMMVFVQWDPWAFRTLGTKTCGAFFRVSPSLPSRVSRGFHKYSTSHRKELPWIPVMSLELQGYIYDQISLADAAAIWKAGKV